LLGAALTLDSSRLKVSNSKVLITSQNELDRNSRFVGSALNQLEMYLELISIHLYDFPWSFIET